MDDSGLDICAFLEEDLIIKPRERVLVPTGIYEAIPDGYELQVRSRSELYWRNFVFNSPGTIDAGYRTLWVIYNQVKMILLLKMEIE